MSAVARRYARAALDAALGSKNDAAAGDALAADLQRISEAYQSSAGLQELLRNPNLKQERDHVLGAVLESLKVGPTAVGVVRVLAANDRIDELSEVARQTESLADVRAGRLRAVVRSTVALSDEQLKRLVKALEKRLDHPVAVSTVVEPELIGGLVCQVGDLTFDSSLKRQLAILTERLGAHA